ncbi:MAG: hypothetical protein MUE91_13450 [Ignavibacteriaceae bacterium]|jgi:hypothetical protein|nr:hypothetical protein [Ignavibacteriaceae bacterium]
MKHFVLFFFLSLFASFFYFGCSTTGGLIPLPTDVIPIHLSTEYNNYINPSDLGLRVNSKYAFVSEDGKDYAVIIRNASQMIDEVEKDYKVRVNDSTQPTYFTVKNVDISEFVIEIYCLTEDNWPDAPPRIIIVSQ